MLHKKGGKSGGRKSGVGLSTEAIKITDTTTSASATAIQHNNSNNKNNTHTNNTNTSINTNIDHNNNNNSQDNDNDNATQRNKASHTDTNTNTGSDSGTATGGIPLPLVTSTGDVFETKRTMNSLGPVLPGPPRMLDLRVEGKAVYRGGGGNGEEGRERSVVRAEAQYIGGKEGLSEYWWFKIMKGKRIQLSEPLPLLEEGQEGQGGEEMQDPRVYVLREEDVGCVLKVKCRPIRSDGHKGEIFTSKASAVIVSSIPSEQEPRSES